ncbi:Uncharacterised protein [Salmonella enterica subsp. arizonae]|nr:Uncharacterised protein [Salmonella enterica subsp. arizonae]
MDSIVLQDLIKKRMVIINSQEKAFTESRNSFSPLSTEAPNTIKYGERGNRFI